MMPVRVELIDAAVEALARYAETGNLPLFLKKLLRLEEVGQEAGLPRGRSLTGWRKIVAGDRNWRIIFTTDPEETVATVWVIGDRDDAACYADAERRLRSLGQARPEAASLAAVMFQLTQLQQSARRARRRPR
jgi:mRNA interferase RelE/StbE